MYDIRQFKPAFYALIVLSLLGYGLAAGFGGVFLLALVLVVVNAFVVFGGAFKPVPRFVANGAVVLGALYLLTRLREELPLAPVAEFLVVLVVVKLWEQRANRDYAQLLVLSLLLMVAAAISTGQLWFGLTLAAWLFLALYVALLFHLKVESDAARKALGLPDADDPAAAARRQAAAALLQHDQRHLPRSMRRLTVTVGLAATLSAVAAFLLVPRGAGAGMFNMSLRPPVASTGFSDNFDLSSVSRLTQDDTVVGHVSVKRGDGTPVTVGPLYLRGLTADQYVGRDANGRRWRWQQAEPSAAARPAPTWGMGYLPGNVIDIDDPQSAYRQPGEREEDLSGADDAWPAPRDVLVQEVTLQPMPDLAVFHLPGLRSFESPAELSLRVTRRDETVRPSFPRNTGGPRALKYTVRSDGVISPLGLRTPPARGWGDRRPPVMTVDADGAARLPVPTALLPRSTIDDRIRALARDPAVSGRAPDGTPLWERLRVGEATDVNRQVAEAIASHLRQNYQYALDVTDLVRAAGDDDPMVGFLFDAKSGYCEYFASGMTLLCQSLNMPARVARGYMTDEVNQTPGADFFIVRQAHAHQWVEVLVPAGWQTFDPTAAAGEPQRRADPSLWSRAAHLVDYLEHAWETNVIAFDRDARAGLLDQLEGRLSHTAANVGGSRTAGRVAEWWRQLMAGLNVYGATAWLVTALMAGMGLVAVGAAAWFAWQRLALRLRARRIGLLELGDRERRALARQLGFYDELLRVLERHGERRPPHATPAEWAATLAHLPAEVYGAVRRLTDVFYAVRYGQRRLPADRRRRLERVVARVAGHLSAGA